AALLRIFDLPVLPPQAAPREHPGPLQADAVENRRDRLERLLRLEKAYRSLRLKPLRERGVLVREGDLTAERGEAVAEAAVDGLLGRPKRRERLASLVRVLELRAHQRTQDAAPTVRRVDADDAHTGRRQIAARNGDVEGERRRAADDRAVRPRR